MLGLAALEHVDSPERGVLLLDNNLNVTCANRRAAEVLGVALEDLVGSPLPDLIMRRPVRPDEVIEEVLHTDAQSERVIHRYSGPVFAADGSPACRVEIYSDITARRRLETEILDRNRELAELNRRLREAQDRLVQSERLRALGEMAAGIAHDINNALGIVLGNAQLAKRKMPQEAELTQCIESIELAARDAAETVRRLKEIGKPVDRSRYGPVDLSTIVEEVISTTVPTWSERNQLVKVETNLANGCIVEGDPAELREALSNILLNAVQAVSGNGLIEISTSLESGRALLRVTDNGVGMNEETKQRVFDPFFTTRGAEGTGLGMSMVAAIAIRHQGEVVVDSEEGIGTTVTLKLPLLDIVDRKVES
ncbi:MAG: ATP-binding protein [Armatimonadetes bacterium]|nr:ATP-binding protein [Armatimonadota bacterium]